ncbi:hypothetical protein MGR01S_03240 [Meiothermus granaticius NBRC 107808]|uniref:DUF3467 domain-containing protein n=2 Tax=Meiothermus TaxID=65551 RepID=A0A399FC28_9DEIN|nr:hypothetical protein Mgrana_00361 [Meiothermus granaticius NBRC 107808]GEM85699.1 hypothetical protein MGR01S_03240 [Meiothermus granaticius NBRC 107808]
MNDAQPTMPELRIDIDRETAGGQYANFAVFSHQKNEFYLDFALLQPQTDPNVVGALVVARIITSPQHAKALLHSLAENISRYEQTFGPIPEAVDPSRA